MVWRIHSYMTAVHAWATLREPTWPACGSFTMKFERYEEVPSNVAQKIIENAKKDEEEED